MPWHYPRNFTFEAIGCEQSTTKLKLLPLCGFLDYCLQQKTLIFFLIVFLCDIRVLDVIRRL